MEPNTFAQEFDYSFTTERVGLVSLLVAENDDNLSLESSRLQGTCAAPGGRAF